MNSLLFTYQIGSNSIVLQKKLSFNFITIDSIKLTLLKQHVKMTVV